jgi:hypothetical protein
MAPDGTYKRQPVWRDSDDLRMIWSAPALITISSLPQRLLLAIRAIGHSL